MISAHKKKGGKKEGGKEGRKEEKKTQIANHTEREYETFYD